MLESTSSYNIKCGRNISNYLLISTAKKPNVSMFCKKLVMFAILSSKQ